MLWCFGVEVTNAYEYAIDRLDEMEIDQHSNLAIKSLVQFQDFLPYESGLVSRTLAYAEANRLEFASRVSFLMALAVCIVHDFKNGEVFIVS